MVCQAPMHIRKSNCKNPKLFCLQKMQILIFSWSPNKFLSQLVGIPGKKNSQKLSSIKINKSERQKNNCALNEFCKD